MADPKGQVAMGTVYPPQQAVPGPQPMAVPYGQPMMAQPMQPVAVAQAMPVQQVAVAQPMPVQPVAAAPMGFGDPGRPPPPGAPPGGQYRHVQYVGIITCAGGLKRRWIVSLFVVPVCCCPCDTKELYFAPDGQSYSSSGSVDNMHGPCNCC